MNRILTLITLFLFLSFSFFGQNLVPNGGFENPRYTDCAELQVPTTNIGYFFNTWYGNGWVYAEPCLSRFNREVISNWEWRFSTPYKGKANAQLFVTSWDDGVFTPYGVMTKLISRLEANEWYYLDMYVRNRGGESFEPSGVDCTESPAPQLQFYVSEDPIEFVVKADGTRLLDTYLSPGRLIGADSSAYLSSFATRPWTNIATCFQAQGKESHLAIFPPLGRFNYAPGCERTDSSNIYDHFFYELDEVQLIKIPEEFRGQVEICENEPDSIHLLDFVPFANAAFLWPDGNTDSVRILPQGGNYEIEVILPCVNLPLYLDVIGNDCSTSIYIPNVFSPNDDGINDEFKVNTHSQWQIMQFEMRIFDRWGGLVFESTDPTKGWSGKESGKTAPPGTYIWTIKYMVNDGKEEIKYHSGDLLLLR